MTQTEPKQNLAFRAPPPSTWRRGPAAAGATVQSATLCEASVAHAFTLRPDGTPPDDRIVVDDARRRREHLCAVLGCDATRLTTMQQVHGARIAIVEPPMAGRRIDGADGLVVDRAGVPLLARSADCPLVVVCDPRRGVLGLAHAGWRGIVAGIVGRLIQTLVDRFGCGPEAMVAAVSPSAGPCCYQVGDDVLDCAAQALTGHQRHFHHRSGSIFFDLWSACVAQLRSTGVTVDRIDLAARCTICDERFYSYRRDGAATEHGSLIAVLSERS